MKIGIAINKQTKDLSAFSNFDFKVPENALKTNRFDAKFLDGIVGDIRWHTIYNPHTVPLFTSKDEFALYFLNWLDEIKELIQHYQITELDISELFLSSGKPHKWLPMKPAKILLMVRVKLPKAKIILNDRFLLWPFTWLKILTLANDFDLDIGFQFHCELSQFDMFLTGLKTFRTFYKGRLHCSEASIWHTETEAHLAANSWGKLIKTCEDLDCESFAIWNPIYNLNGYRAPMKPNNTSSGILKVTPDGLIPLPAMNHFSKYTNLNYV